MGFEPLGSIIDARAKRGGMQMRLMGALAIEYFNAVVARLLTPAIAESIRALYLKDGTLVIAVLSPALAQELKLREQTIIEQVNQRFGTTVVEHLRFLA